MKIKDLKVGDVIYISEDVNEPENPWVNKYDRPKTPWENKYDKPRLTKVQQIFRVDYENGYFEILGELDKAVVERHTYTVEMIDLEKTRALKMNESLDH